jgi:hypothetical protein
MSPRRPLIQPSSRPASRACRWVARRLEQPDRLAAGVFRTLELAGTPGQEVGQPELDRGPPGVVGGSREQAVDSSQRPDGRFGLGVRAVVDHPLRLPVHRLEHVKPALVAGRQDVGQLGEQVERLPERLSLLGLAHGVEQNPHRLVIAGLGRPGEVQRGLGEPP